MTIVDQYLLRASEEDVVQAFMGECCKVVTGARTEAGKMYAAYALWAPRCGFTMSIVAFGRAMRAVGIQSHKSNCIQWHDIALREPTVTSDSPI